MVLTFVGRCNVCPSKSRRALSFPRARGVVGGDVRLAFALMSQTAPEGAQQRSVPAKQLEPAQ
eukprot:7130931-Pyramimonas_sp.AAC.1